MYAPTIKARSVGTMIGLAGTLGIALSAQAGEPTAPTYDSVVVRYADLNLETAAGAQTLYARISKAAERACGNDDVVRELQRQLRYRECRDAAISRAVQKLGNPQLQVLHQSGRTPRKVG